MSKSEQFREYAKEAHGTAITFTLRRTRSAASSPNRPYWPSAQRNSTATFWPS